MKELNFDFNKLIIHPQFEETIEEISRMNVSLPDLSSNIEFDYNNYVFPENGELVTPIKKIDKIKLDPEAGQKLVNKEGVVSAYDESINRFNSLEGTAYFTSHSLVVLGDKDYMPIDYLTFYFYTRSQDIVNKSKYIKLSQDPEVDSKEDCVKDKILFLEKAVPSKSILLIDGPLIGGNVSSYMISAIQSFTKKDIIPIFFIKNSSSNMVTDNIKQLKSKYNSDLHWSYDYLKLGERTNFFHYTDKKSHNKTKIFCYLKAFNVSPQRIEMHIDTYIKYEKIIPKIMDMVYYLMLVQGDLNNPQARPIAVAEKYARATLSLIDINKIMKEVGISPTMNQTRFGW
jgi:hypothetical protein